MLLRERAPRGSPPGRHADTAVSIRDTIGRRRLVRRKFRFRFPPRVVTAVEGTPTTESARGPVRCVVGRSAFAAFIRHATTVVLVRATTTTSPAHAVDAQISGSFFSVFLFSMSACYAIVINTTRSIRHVAHGVNRDIISRDRLLLQLLLLWSQVSPRSSSDRIRRSVLRNYECRFWKKKKKIRFWKKIKINPIDGESFRDFDGRHSFTNVIGKIIVSRHESDGRLADRLTSAAGQHRHTSDCPHTRVARARDDADGWADPTARAVVDVRTGCRRRRDAHADVADRALDHRGVLLRVPSE